jgi:spoIIIJ-associated protein
MTEYHEYEGKTIEHALEIASKELDRAPEEIKYDIVSHGSSGIFGIVGVKKAKIRVHKKFEKAAFSNDIQQEAKRKARDLVKDAFEIEDSEEDGEQASEQDFDEEIEPPAEQLAMAIEIGKQVLKRLVDFITEETTIQAETQQGRILLRVEGGKAGLLIGKRGQTLEALQYLVEKIVNKKCDQRVRILVDVEGYLETRTSNLKKLAGRMAEKAKAKNKPVTIGQMNAYDRRIVHLHLKDNNAVRTQSMGEGYYRKLVIFPKKRRRSRQPN